MKLSKKSFHIDSLYVYFDYFVSNTYRSHDNWWQISVMWRKVKNSWQTDYATESSCVLRKTTFDLDLSHIICSIQDERLRSPQSEATDWCWPHSTGCKLLDVVINTFFFHFRKITTLPVTFVCCVFGHTHLSVQVS